MDQRTYGNWYFHRAGKSGSYRGGIFKRLDLTLGNENITFGILIRSIYSAEDDKVICGPCNSVHKILETPKVSSIMKLTKVFLLSEINCKELHLEDVKDMELTVYTGPRVGLSTKYNTSDLQYRFFTCKKYIKKQKRSLLMLRFCHERRNYIEMDYDIKYPERFDEDLLLINKAGPSLVEKTLYFKVISREEQYVEVGINVFLIPPVALPVFVATVDKLINTNYPFLIVKNIHRFPYKKVTTETLKEKLPAVIIDLTKKYIPIIIEGKVFEPFKELTYKNLLLAMEYGLMSEVKRILDIVVLSEDEKDTIAYHVITSKHIIGRRKNILKLLLNKGIVMTYHDTDAAIDIGDSEVVEFLILHLGEKGKDPLSFDSRTLAIKSDRLEMVKLLVKYGEEMDTDHVILAAHIGNLEIVEYLLSIVPVDYTDLLIPAVSGNNMEMIKYLLDNGIVITDLALISAVENGYYKMVDFLTNKISPDTKKVLEIASETGDLKMVRLLMDKEFPVSTNVIRNAARLSTISSYLFYSIRRSNTHTV